MDKEELRQYAKTLQYTRTIISMVTKEPDFVDERATYAAGILDNLTNLYGMCEDFVEDKMSEEEINETKEHLNTGGNNEGLIQNFKDSCEKCCAAVKRSPRLEVKQKEGADMHFQNTVQFYTNMLTTLTDAVNSHSNRNTIK